MREKIKLYMQSLRLERWPRSLAIIPGFIAVFILSPELLKTVNLVDLLLRLGLGFGLTWLISTANYIASPGRSDGNAMLIMGLAAEERAAI